MPILNIPVDEVTLEACRRLAVEDGASLEQWVRLVLTDVAAKAEVAPSEDERPGDAPTNWLEVSFQLMEQQGASLNGWNWSREDLYAE